MTRAATIAREEAITEALRVADAAIGQETPTDQAMRIITALKGLRTGEQLVIANEARIDYLQRVQSLARTEWNRQHGTGRAGVLLASRPTGPDTSSAASISTPIGILRMVAWRARWAGANGEREVWAGEYTLNGEPISVSEIKAAGLARRPTSRRRKGRASVS